LADAALGEAQSASSDNQHGAPHRHLGRQLGFSRPCFDSDAKVRPASVLGSPTAASRRFRA